jgi:hypothetical protein
MRKMLRRLPVKTRLPLEAWLLAGAVTLFSVTSSVVQYSHQWSLQAAKEATTHIASLVVLRW